MCPALPPIATDAAAAPPPGRQGFSKALSLGPGAGRHSLPRSCWDLVASVEGQRLQSRRFAQNLEKICGAIDTFAVVAKAPGAR